MGLRENAALVRAQSAPGVRRRKEPFNEINRPGLGWVRGCLATWGFLNGAIGETKPGGETKATSLSLSSRAMACQPREPPDRDIPVRIPEEFSARSAHRDTGAAGLGAVPSRHGTGCSAVPRVGLSCVGG